MDDLFFLLKSAALLVTPICLGLSWLMWMNRRRQYASTWRRRTLTVGLVAATLNAALFGVAVVADNTALGQTTFTSAAFGNYVVVPLLAIALVGSWIGDGRERWLISLAAIAEFFLWVPAAFL